MNKGILITLLITLATFVSNQELASATAVKESIKIDDIIVKPLPYKRCYGICVSIDTKFPHDSTFAGPWRGWQTSHGSPSVSANNAWMWSAYSRGEGINLKYSFAARNQYCIDIYAMTNTRGNSPAHPNSKANMILTTSTVLGQVTSAGGGAIPAVPAGSQTLWNAPYTSLPDGGSSNYIFNFTSNNNYNNIWFYPSATSVPVAELAIKQVTICKIDEPCDYKLRIWSRSYCNYVNFYPSISLPGGSSARIIGYVWDFGDGTFSNEANPNHYYVNGGGYVVTLTVLTVTNDGRCCTKKFYYKVYVQACKPCENIKYANIKITNLGSLTKFEPTVPHNNMLIYKWTFADGTSYTTREVFKTNIVQWVQLSIWYTGYSTDCCNNTIKRYIWIIKDPIREIAYPSLTKADLVSLEESSAEVEIKRRIETVAKEENNDNTAEIVELADDPSLALADISTATGTLTKTTDIAYTAEISKTATISP